MPWPWPLTYGHDERKMCLYVVDISAQLYWNSFIIKKVAGWTWIKFPQIFLFLNTFDLAETLTFDLQTWVLHPTHRLHVVSICAHLYWNSFIVKKKLQAGHEHSPPKFPFFKHIWLCRDLEHWPTDMTVACNTSSLCGWHVCTVILKSIYNWRSYRPDTNISPKKFHFLDTFDLAVTLTFDLRTWLLHATHHLYMVDISA